VLPLRATSGVGDPLSIGAALVSHGLGGGAHEDLVERDALRPADGEGDDIGDVLPGIPISAVAVLFACLLAGSVM
jgi:hypothetical protein